MSKSLRLLPVLALLAASPDANAQVWDWNSLPDPRGEFIRLCAPHLASRWAHPESVCLCLHDTALATVSDPDLRHALMRGIAETGVPTIENAWVPAAKLPQLSATFDIIAQPTLHCMFTQDGLAGRDD